MSARRESCCSEYCCSPSHSDSTLLLRAQTFNLDLDTGSSDLWFASTACTTCPEGTPKLDPTKSSTFEIGDLDVVLNYGSGTASGTIARDTVSMGPLTVTPQIYGANPHLFSGIRLFERAVCSMRPRWRRNMSAKSLPSVLTGVLVTWSAWRLFKNLSAVATT